MINTLMEESTEIIDPYEGWQNYTRICQDDEWEDIIDESQEPEARRILAEISRRKKERIANKAVAWLEEGF